MTNNWRNFKSLPTFEGSFSIWQNFEPTLENVFMLLDKVFIFVVENKKIEKVIYPSGRDGGQRPIEI